MAEGIKIPGVQLDIASLMLKESLYSEIDVTGITVKSLYDLRWGGFKFDAYCVYCKKETPFKSAASTYTPAVAEATKDAFFNRNIICTRGDHAYCYEFRLVQRRLMKIGQYPSIEDIAGAELKRFRGVLEDDDAAELKRASGLFSHGIGVGSFVYLRRIFERMIYRHRARHQGEIEGFDAMRMDEKIRVLADVLPPALVKYRSVYGVLSLGVHEMSEDDCKAVFPAVRSGIVMMLEQELEAKERAAAETALDRDVQAATAFAKARLPK